MVQGIIICLVKTIAHMKAWLSLKQDILSYSPWKKPRWCWLIPSIFTKNKHIYNLWVWYDMISFQIGNSHVELRPWGLGKGGILRPSVWLLNTRSWLILLPRQGFMWHLNVTQFDVTEEIRWVYHCMSKPAISSMSDYILLKQHTWRKQSEP